MISGFAPSSSNAAASHRSPFHVLQSEATATADETAAIQTDPKEAVKLFGRLAEKYIMLDASAGMCCYSGCTGASRLLVESIFWCRLFAF